MPPVTLSGAGLTMSVGVNRTGSGIITVTWTAVSAVDGHFTAGSFAWCVQNPDPNGTGCSGAGLGATSSGAPISPFEVGLRFIAFFGLAAALGASVLGAVMWIPAGRDPDVKETAGYRLGFQVVTNVGRIGAFGFALAYAGLFLLTDALESTGGSSSVVGSPYKLSVILTLAVGAVLFVVLSNAFMRARKDPPESTHRYLLLGSWDALFSSGYGWVVLAKVSLFVPMIAFGAYNRYRLIPRAAETGDPAAAFRKLTWNVRNETAIGATVLVLAAILASLTPAVSVFAGSSEFTLSDTVSGIHIQMIIDPPPASANISYTVQFLLTWASNGSAFNFGNNTHVI